MPQKETNFMTAINLTLPKTAEFRQKHVTDITASGGIQDQKHCTDGLNFLQILIQDDAKLVVDSNVGRFG